MPHSSEKRYLPEIQGLRTLAALLVAIYHIWLQKVSGGVDVFFVVAAFFMVLSLSKHQHLSFQHVAHYFLNTLRRVMPVMAAVMVLTILGLLFFSPEIIWKNEIESAFASLFFYQNKYLATQGTDYLNQGLNSSVFQQFWALSLQIQMALFLPLLMLGIAVSSRQYIINYRNTLLCVFLVICCSSMAYSIVFTQQNQPAAYFSSPARLWEFMVGGVLALLITRLKISKLIGNIIGSIGVLILCLFGYFFDVSNQFPGYMAMVPCLAACMIIVASYNGSFVPFVSNRIIVRSANYSFAFYLWHWPILCFYRNWSGSNDIDILTGLSIIVVSFILAYISTRTLELPVRHSAYLKKGYTRTASFAFLTALLVLVPLTTLELSYKKKQEEAQETLKTYMTSGFEIPDDIERDKTAVIPHPIIARKDRPKPYQEGCDQKGNLPEVIICTYGNLTSDKTIALVGGSHSTQWFSALEILSDKYNFKLLNITKGGCALTLSDPGLGVSQESWESCFSWNQVVLENLAEIKPDLVVTIGTRVVNGVEQVPEGYRSAWKILENAGIAVLVLRDNPRFDFDVPFCLEQNINFSACSRTKSSYYAVENPLLIDTPKNVFPADFSDIFCRDNLCPAAIDKILIYRDKNHLTQTFVTKNYGVMENAIASTGKVF